MQPIDCQQCGTTVLVEKYSNQHTSVQWLRDAATSCHRFAEAAPGDGDRPCGTTDLSCPALRSTINEAVREGRVTITSRTEPIPGRIT